MSRIEPGVVEAPVLVPTEQHEDDPEVRCARCGHGLAHRSDAIAAGGSHRHTFRNPSGYSYQLACFADAPGCSAAGELTDEHTWFAGYQWALALCGACGTHVGWWFVGAGGSFAGLIVPRVR